VTTSVSGDTITITGSASAQGITFVGDDSTGTRVSDGESFKVAGTQNITTAVSGDTLTITGPDLSSYATQSYVTSQGYITNSPITVVGDDSTGVTLNSNETIKIAGTQNITTAVSADTLTITGPDLTNYAQKSDKAVTIVGDDSTGTDINIGETFKIAGSGSVTTAVSGDTLTITGSGGGIPLAGATYNLNANAGLAIYTTDGGIDFLRNGVTGIGIRGEGLHIYAANSYILWDGSVLKFPSGSDIQRDDGNGSFVSVLGVPKTIDVNEISSGDSSAIQINDAVNVSGAGTFHGSVRFNAGYTENINALTSSSTITVNCATASIHTVTLAVSTGFVISNLPTGGTVTLIITQGGSGSYTATFGTDGSTTVKFPGGAPTLSTAVGAIDVVTIFNDGTNYLGNIAKAYAA
jgi:hypothetical protein